MIRTATGVQKTQESSIYCHSASSVLFAYDLQLKNRYNTVANHGSCQPKPELPIEHGGERGGFRQAPYKFTTSPPSLVPSALNNE